MPGGGAALKADLRRARADLRRLCPSAADHDGKRCGRGGVPGRDGRGRPAALSGRAGCRGAGGHMTVGTPWPHLGCDVWLRDRAERYRTSEATRRFPTRSTCSGRFLAGPPHLSVIARLASRTQRNPMICKPVMAWPYQSASTAIALIG
ncbi:hypothetical protein SDC9_32099 [bioreactor metagenome]|uniref:Uncharacterized protein n=1 Tax=bioreactor metagenome TaxID=1076179 RepID=A0A644V5M9_9ZZZZ